MATSLRRPTLQTLGLGGVLDIFQSGQLPVRTSDLIDQIFGPETSRGALVISGANGIVGAGKTLQLGSRLHAFNVPVVALDLAGAPDGLSRHYSGLVENFGSDKAARIVSNIVRLSYDGKTLPNNLKALKPCVVIEAIPEVLALKRDHYALFRRQFPTIEIRSVTSGFPSSELGVGVTHPAFPHHINKVWEVVEDRPSRWTQLLWSLGLIPVPVSDHWSFVLDVLFCGLTLSALRYHSASNMPYWKIDKCLRRLLGPNPLRAHDAIGAKGANYLSWSCLHHLSQKYGGLFTPTQDITERKDTGQTWYPLNHFRPLVNWTLDGAAEEEFNARILGPTLQMTSLLLYENRAHPAALNAIGELCAQFRSGCLAIIRKLGTERAIELVESYHKRYPDAQGCWFPDVFESMDSPDWKQLYVNAEHDGTVGVISVSRESYNQDVDEELNRAVDWLIAQGIRRVILTGDFHLSTQMIGADTSEFYGALENEEEGFQLSMRWSRTARRLYDDFAVSVGFIAGKRCLGGFLELLLHCHHLISVENASVGMPEVTLPVIPGMEGCHWPFRKYGSKAWPMLFDLLLSGKLIKAKDTVGWLIDAASPLEDALRLAWNTALGDSQVPRHAVVATPIEGVMESAGQCLGAARSEEEQAKRAILECIKHSCETTLTEALSVQAKHTAVFLAGPICRKGKIGADYEKTVLV